MCQLQMSYLRLLLAKGVMNYPITVKTDQGARYAMAASVASPRVDVQVMNDIQQKTQLSVKDRVGIGNVGTEWTSGSQGI